jgi:Ni/Fe-hydrogenase subunit HybB-like protein
MTTRFKLTKLQIWLLFLSTIMIAGLVAGVIVFAKGLVVTNLTDLVPWGLWITIDLSAIAMSAGAFLLCAAVYLLGLKRYQPVARTATFIGLLGYSMAVMTLLLDIGRPDRFWHALVYWNTHSLLWEVTMCVTLYLTVLVIEVAPIIGHAHWFESRFRKLATWMQSAHNLAPYLAVVGLVLSMLHQSSLGATYGVLKARPIWYRPDLSVLFILSAAVGGLSLTTLASMISARLSNKANVKDELLERLSFVVGWALVGYLYFRFWDALSMSYTYQPGRTEGLNMLTSGPLAVNFWFGEIILGIIVPMIILLNNRMRNQPALRMLALGFVVGGIIAYRWDTTLAGQLIVLTYLPQEIIARYTSYVPSLIEILAGAGVVAFGFLAFTIGVQWLGVVDHSDSHEEMPEAVPALATSAAD